jgi:hypothetical protein
VSERAELGTSWTSVWLLSWWDICCAWRARSWYLLRMHSFYAFFFRFRSEGGGLFFSGSFSKQPN